MCTAIIPALRKAVVWISTGQVSPSYIARAYQKEERKRKEKTGKKGNGKKCLVKIGLFSIMS